MVGVGVFDLLLHFLGGGVRFLDDTEFIVAIRPGVLLTVDDPVLGPGEWNQDQGLGLCQCLAPDSSARLVTAHDKPSLPARPQFLQVGPVQLHGDDLSWPAAPASSVCCLPPRTAEQETGGSQSDAEDGTASPHYRGTGGDPDTGGRPGLAWIYRGWLGYTGDWLGYTGGLLDWAGLLDPPETWRRCGAGGEGDLARCGGTCIYLESETDTEQNRIEKLFLSLLLLLLTRI